MDRPDDLIDDRWLLYRRARENGATEVEAYDHYLHPRTRISDAELVQETSAGDHAAAEHLSEGLTPNPC